METNIKTMNQAEIEENVWLSALRLGLNDSCRSQALTNDTLDSRQGQKPGSRPNNKMQFVQTILHKQSLKHCLINVS